MKHHTSIHLAHLLYRSRRYSLVALVAVLSLWGLGCSTERVVEPNAPVDTAGPLVIFDELMEEFMSLRQIEAGLIGIMKDGEIIYEKGFGWRDSLRQNPLPPNGMMRLASVSKPITAAAIRNLVREGRLRLDDRAFDLGQPGGGILKLEPFPSLGDTLLSTVTIMDLLRHRSGWDRDIAGDLTYLDIDIARRMNIPSPPEREEIVRYILGQPLQFAPGTRDAYSNIGYLVLGLIIEEVTGKDYMTFIYESVLDPLGVPRSELIQGRTFPEDRSPREPWYDYRKMGRNVYDPTGPLVRMPDGGWNHEARLAQGGLVASTRALLYFLDTYQVNGEGIGTRRNKPEGGGWKWNHGGSQRGVNVTARQRGDGINFVVLFNKRPASGTGYSTQIRNAIDQIIDSGEVEWPN